MADGRTHTLVAVVAGGVGVGALVAFHQPTAPWYAGGALASLLITPDLDKIEPTISAALAGPLRLPWRLFWLPYGLIPHRHWLSHAPVIGTLGRLAYLALGLAGISALARVLLPPALVLPLPTRSLTHILASLGLAGVWPWRLPTALHLPLPHLPGLRVVWQWIKAHPQSAAAAAAPLFVNDTLHALWDGWRWQRSQWSH